METPRPLEEWAKSLVGRDWEIFWSDDGCCEDLESQQREEQPAVAVAAVAAAAVAANPEATQGEQTSTGETGEATTDDESEDIEDWYDGQVEAVESIKEDGSYSFHVRFVGDETRYTMVLEPKNVRPSATVWIKRSKALLNFQAQPSSSSSSKTQKDLADWETSLPPDSSTVDDKEHLAQLQAQHVGNEASQSTPPDDAESFLMADNTQTHNMPDLSEVNQIMSLAKVLSAQVYLRSRLAPIVELDGGPSETYVDHLLQCLTCLAEACRWYLESWELHRIVFFNARMPGPSTGATKLEEDYAIKTGLQAGRRVVTQLLRIDTSLAGSKKRRPAEKSPGGTRKTKRRRRNKSLLDFIKESERGSKTPSPDEDEFLSSNAVTNFVEQVHLSDNRWYTSHFGKMMQSLSLNIVAPLLLWKHRVETMLGDRPESDGEKDHSDGETSGEESDEEGDQTSEGNMSEQSAKGKRFYTFDEINACEDAARNDPVLQKFELSKWQDRLRLKLSEVEDFEQRCWSLVSQVFSKPNGAIVEKEIDIIFLELVQVRDTALSSASAVSNVSPLGHSSSVLSRKVVDDAITIRSWYLDLRRVESSKERLVFIDKMATRASELPRLPPSDYSAALDGLFDEAVARLRRISQGYFDHLTRFNKYRSILLSRSIPEAEEEVDFMTSVGVTGALQELGNIQVLSIAEEMLSVRLDVLRWKANAQCLLAKADIPFAEMVALKKSVDAILDGRSDTRTRMLASIEANDKVNAEVRSFAEADVTALCGSLVSLINSKYSIACGWKERANSVVSAIKQHNGQYSMAQKPPPMVDFKRIHGLLLEYQNMGVFLPEDRSFLEEVYATASKWSKELTDALLERTNSFGGLLACLQSSKVDRPKGLMVDPARHVVDILVDLLFWHKQIVESMKDASGRTGETPPCNPKSLHPLIAEGSEVLEVFGTRSDETTYSVNRVVALDLMFKELDSRRPMRVISCTKLESNALGTTLLDRMIREDKEQGSPLLFLLLTLWQASVSDLIQKYDSRRGTKTAITLESAKDLVLKRPIGEESERWGMKATEQENNLFALVSEGEKTEKEALRLLAVSKELFRGPYRHAEAIDIHLGAVKELHGLFKIPLTSNGSGLTLKKHLEQKLDHHVKVLGWLVRTLPYPFLHQVHFDLIPENRMPWDILVILHERKPGGLEKMGDCAGIALRLAEVFEAANAWQQEITKVTMLSNRGGKRRGDSSGVEAAEGSALQMVDVEKVHRLAKDPVLKKVAMPRESAVTGILESAKEFETHLHKFLGKDYDGINPDRAPYPDTRSLIGRSGEFLLYRLTGGPLYASLLSSIERIATIGQDVLADTPGKAAFEWIRQAVLWIDTLRAAVTRKAYPAGTNIDRLAIAESDARSILDNGKSFFLDIPEDLRKTLSAHRIFVSRNKEGDKLKVVFKKGGAHHSVGGTAIRWCPVLFDSLKEDLSRLDIWRAQVEKVESSFKDFACERNGLLNDDEEALMSLHGFLEEVAMLIEEGVESLVVAPPKETFETLNELQTNLTSLLTQNSSSSLDERIAKRRFEDSEMLLADRYKLLDSLLSRSGLESENLDLSAVRAVSDLEGSTFRDSCRAYLEKALQRTLHLIGLEPADPGSPDLTLCSTKAWEIEREMFSRFQANLDADVISSEYKEKARTLRWVFEDCANPNVCIQILLGELEVSELVGMSEEQLVGKPHSDVNLSPSEPNDGLRNPVKQPDAQDEEGAAVAQEVANEGNVKAIAPIADAKVAADAAIESSSASPEPEAKSSPREAKVEAVTNTSGMNTSLDTSPDTEPYHSPDASPAFLSSPRPEAPPSLAVPVRPEAPPSLAASLAKPGLNKKSSSKSSQSKSSSSKRGKYLLNSSGGDSFLLAVSKPLLRFHARFYLESAGHVRLNNLLPENMTEKGRLRVEEFAKFLSGKLKGGRWVAVPFRMSIVSDEDAKKHKKFYKEYESMKRIAMFAVSENAKLFLVTPKFHRTAGKILGTSFSTETSTYAIVLTREIR